MSKSLLSRFGQKDDLSMVAGGDRSNETRLGFEALNSLNKMVVVVSSTSSRNDWDLARSLKL